jgi:flagellar hook assembly protein FlgD
MTRIRYSLSSATDVSLTVLDAGGRLKRVLATGPQGPGVMEAVWDGRDEAGREVPSGFYFSRLETGTAVQRRGMILLR